MMRYREVAYEMMLNGDPAADIADFIRFNGVVYFGRDMKMEEVVNEFNTIWTYLNENHGSYLTFEALDQIAATMGRRWFGNVNGVQTIGDGEFYRCPWCNNQYNRDSPTARTNAGTKMPLCKKCSEKFDYQKEFHDELAAAHGVTLN